MCDCGPHFGEERVLVGRRGSGTVFFGGCNLGCVFCQNYSLSRPGAGTEVDAAGLARVMLDIQRLGCANLNLVTPTPHLAAILFALALAAADGLRLPVVWNCGGYEDLAAIALLDGIVDIYMPDVKFSDPDVAARLATAPDYWDRAREAVSAMHRQVGDLVLDESGLARRGLLVRHLVLPGGLAGTREVARFLAREVSRDSYVNIMGQYRPEYLARRYPPLDRRPTADEVEAAREAARAEGLWRFDR